MNATPLDNLAATPGLGARRPPAGPPTARTEEALTEQTRKWVSQTFFGEILRQMRESPFKSDLFSGGRGGQTFGSLFDQQLADRMAGGAGDKLVSSIVRRLMGQANHAAPSAADRGKDVRDASQAGPDDAQRDLDLRA